MAGGLPLCRDAVGVFYSALTTRLSIFEIQLLNNNIIYKTDKPEIVTCKIRKTNPCNILLSWWKDNEVINCFISPDSNVYKRITENSLVGWLIVRVLWHINLCRLFKTKSILWKMFYFKQLSLAWVHSLIVKNVSISSYSV